jgi:NAD(P)-dependent dehydrogenase (short-subunit alcohol dehydrogenase family)
MEAGFDAFEEAGVEEGDDCALDVGGVEALGRASGSDHAEAAAVAFLASDDATFVTGETLGVSGGHLEGLPKAS